MNRRLMMALLAGAVITPEGVWQPGKKTIFLPPRRLMIDADDLGKFLIRPWHDPPAIEIARAPRNPIEDPIYWYRHYATSFPGDLAVNLYFQRI